MKYITTFLIKTSFCPCQCRHTDTDSPYRRQGIGASRQGGSGGQHIIHQQDVFPFQQRCLGSGTEQAFHIHPAGIPALLGLRRIVPHPPNRVRTDGKPGFPGYAPRQKLALDRKSTRLNSSHWNKSRMPSSA